MQIMENPNNYTKIKLLLDGKVFREINLPSNKIGQLLFENTENILADEETCEEMDGGFTKIRSKSKCQTDLIPNQERNRVALTHILRKQSK